jgi:hypothetical protein
MKKPQLRNIIRESIKGLMKEQSVQYTMSNIQDAITAAPVDFKYTVCREEAVAAGYWTSTGNTGCFYVTLPNASAQQLQTPFLTGNYSLVDAANDPNSGFYSFEYGGVNDCPAGCAAYNSGGTGGTTTTTTTTPVVLNPGCTDPTAINYDATADGCEVNGVVDTNDTSCCMIQPGGSTTPINVGPPMASNDTKFATPTPNPSDPQMKRMKKSNLKETIKKTIKEMMSGGMLNEAEYCNGAGQDPATHTNCHERGVGCLNMEDHFFGVMGQCVTCDPEWACVSVAPGGPTLGPTLDPGVRRGTKDPKFNDPNLIKMATRNMFTEEDLIGPKPQWAQDWLDDFDEFCNCPPPYAPCQCNGAVIPPGVPVSIWKTLQPIATPDVIERLFLTDRSRDMERTRRGKFGSEEPSIDNMAHEAATNMLSEAEVCWFGRKNYANPGYTCVARGCNFTGPTNNPGGWADINDGAGYENVHECNQWMAVQMTMPGGNPGTNNPTLATTNSVRSAEVKPTGGGKISMDRMMRESATNLFCEREGLDDEEVTTFRITSIGKNGERGESSIANKNHKIIRALDLTNATKVRQLTKGENNIREVEDAPRDLTPQTGKYFCCWLRGGCCEWERNYDAPHRDSSHKEWAGYVIEWDACCGNSGKGRCC